MNHADINRELLAIKLYEMKPHDTLRWIDLPWEKKNEYREAVRSEFDVDHLYTMLGLR